MFSLHTSVHVIHYTCDVITSLRTCIQSSSKIMYGTRILKGLRLSYKEPTQLFAAEDIYIHMFTYIQYIYISLLIDSV